MKKLLSLLFNVSILVLIICTNIITQSLRNDKNNATTKRFERVENVNIKNLTSTIFFPNKDGDFWEYIEEDTTTLFGQFYALKFSVSREVANDTLMNNGLTYKRVKWHNEANSVNYPTEYEYLRVDSIGNTHIYYDNSDYILFDFTLEINQTYPSHAVDYYWKVLDKYNVIGFGDTLQAIDFGLFNQNNNMVEIYSIVENFGIIFYRKDLLNYAEPTGNFWGAVINGQEYGTLIVKKQIVDWKEFYPLHIGDYWVYEGYNNGTFTINTDRIIGDTIMLDSNPYYIFRSIDYNYQDTLLSYRRLDSLGSVLNWEWWNANTVTHLEFNFTVGDTSRSPFSIYQVWRNDNKYISPDYGEEELIFYTYPDLTFNIEYYTQKIGLSQWSTEHNYRILVGAYVNNNYWGDTTLTDMDDDIDHAILDYKLFPNYPNPFNSSTLISFQIPKSSIVSLSIYNILGEKIETLINEYLLPGIYKTKFEKNYLPSGVYIYSLTTDGIKLSSKMIYLK